MGTSEGESVGPNADDMAAQDVDLTFEEEQRHLSEVYATVLRLRDELAEELDVKQREAAQDLRTMSEELRPDVAGVEADEAMETLAAIETLNAVIDAYNQRRDFAQERMQRVLALLRQPYFAKVRLKMRPNRPARDVYIGAVGLTDSNRAPLVVDWRSPVAETYYKQENGKTSFVVDGRVRNVELELRRQFDIDRDVLHMYFDTTVAIEDSLLLGALKRHHSPKLQAITATIQREQNEVVRHADVPTLLVSGIAGSGKTSVLLQRIAYLFYQERGHLRADQVCLFTPNAVFQHYIDSVLPSLGESNPRVLTWQRFVDEQGLGGRDTGRDTDPEALRGIDPAKPAAAMLARNHDCRSFRDGMDFGRNVWCIAGAPVKAWARKVFPGMGETEALYRLWAAILSVARADGDDPKEAWETHNATFVKNKGFLNESAFDALRYRSSNGTDLVVGLNEGHLWEGGASRTTGGTTFFPNMPTEEVFTSPDRMRADGIVYSVLPLVHGGQVVRDFWIRFEGGKVTDFDAIQGKDVLRHIIETDENSCRLGEVALISKNTPIRQSGLLFYDTLYDENASCHLALGTGFPECLRGGLDMTPEELVAHGVNHSHAHVDFMVGADDLCVWGVSADGTQTEVFVDGQWVWESQQC